MRLIRWPCTSNRSATGVPRACSPCAKPTARSKLSSAARSLDSACTSASLPVRLTATRSACSSISRDSARSITSTPRNARSISERIAQTMVCSTQPIQAMRKSLRESDATKSSSLSRRATSCEVIWCAM